MSAVHEQSIDVALSNQVDVQTITSNINSFNTILSTMSQRLLKEGANGSTAVFVNKSGQLGNVVRLHSLSNQSSDTETLNEDSIFFLGASKQLGNNEEVRSHLSSLVKQILADRKRSGVTVVDSNTMEVLGTSLHVRGHVVPQPGRVLRLLTVSKLDAIAPNDHLSKQIGLRLVGSEVN